MAEESVLQLPANLSSEEIIEEITDALDEITVDEDALTGTHVRSDITDAAKTGPYTPQAGSPARASAPPPVPPEARQSRPPAPPASRSSAVPPPPRVPSHSGMFRIERPSAPPLPPPGAMSAETPAEPTSAESAELREMRAHVHRLRLMVRLREDRIRELEAVLREQGERMSVLQSEVAGVKTQRGPDDLKRIPGIGPSFERGLHAAGVTSYTQIAAWTPDDIENIALKLRIVSKRIVRDRWVESARQFVADEEVLLQASTPLEEGTRPPAVD
jgi:predicted flap endonuclease-1-like 5' DNA nuclease